MFFSFKHNFLEIYTENDLYNVYLKDETFCKKIVRLKYLPVEDLGKGINFLYDEIKSVDLEKEGEISGFCKKFREL